MKARFLFPNSCKRLGWIILLPSSVLGIAVLFFDVQFGFLDGKAFTIFYQGLNGNPMWFGLISENYTNTLTGVLFLLSAMLVVFSKEKTEDEFIARVRLESLVWATYVNYAILIFCFLFFFQFEFMLVMIFNMFTILVFFIIRFQFVLYRSKKLLGNEK